MERLTKKIDGGTVFPEGLVGVTLTPDNPIMCKMLLRLATYEDSGCAPEEIDMDHEAAETLRQLCQGCDLDRLEKLAEADKDERVVVLPCKIGDKLYRVFAGEIFEHRVGSMKYFAIQGRWDIETYPFCPCVESSIGETIFLTREEAEKALEAMREEEVT
jgi:hypothetical protein